MRIASVSETINVFKSLITKRKIDTNEQKDVDEFRLSHFEKQTLQTETITFMQILN